MKRAVVAVVLACAFASHAQEQKQITIAIYAPNAPFDSGADRFAFVTRLAQQVTSVAGVPAQGKAFARASDLEAAIKAKQIDFAVVDGVYLAQRNVPFPVLAVATSGGDTSPKWGLFVSGSTSVQDLQGKKLSLAASGPRDQQFIENALLDGELQIGKFFSSRSTAPDIASAVAAVNLKKADAVFAPESQGKGLKKIFDAGRVPNPAFCEVGNAPPDIIDKVKKAVLSHGAAGPGLDGWKSGDAGAYRSLSGRMNARGRRPIMVEPEVVRLEDQDILVPPSLEAAQPDLKTQFWMPTP